MDNPFLQSLFDDQERRPLTVTELNEEVKTTLEKRFSNVWLEAEISDFSEPNSGHWYFTLQDGRSQIKAACFKGTNWKIRFQPFDGLQVRVRGSLSVYTVRGDYQLLVDSLEPVGEGALKVAFEQVKEKLRSEGLFAIEHKKPLPFLPKRVGVVTSPTGAAIHDIINVISRRTKTVDVVLIPAVVQGETAPDSIRNGILLANNFNSVCGKNKKLDVLIVGRGGGSAEDLSAFNEERLARTIFDSAIPVISAVGHEIDVSISDFVADMRAATPSAAAELVAQREDDLDLKIRTFAERAVQLIEMRMLSSSQRLAVARDAAVFRMFPDRVTRLKEQNEALNKDLQTFVSQQFNEAGNKLWALQHRLSPTKLLADLTARKLRLGLLNQRSSAAIRNETVHLREELKTRMAQLDALSPLAVLDRGYSITRRPSGRVISDSTQVEVGDQLNIVLSRGKLSAKVTARETGKDPDSNPDK